MKNMTPHTINFYRPNDLTYAKDTRRWVRISDAEPFAVITSDGCARVQYGLSKPDDVLVDGIAVPVLEKPMLELDPLPQGEPCIVSLVYAQAYRAKRGHDGTLLYTVGDTIVDDHGAIIGAKNLVKA